MGNTACMLDFHWLSLDVLLPNLVVQSSLSSCRQTATTMVSAMYRCSIFNFPLADLSLKWTGFLVTRVSVEGRFDYMLVKNVINIITSLFVFHDSHCEYIPVIFCLVGTSSTSDVSTYAIRHYHG